MSNSLPIVALVGPPNAGKSTLLNKIAGRPLAVTSEVAGTTRDRQYADTAWNGANFTLVDTAGLALGPNDELEQNIVKQIEVALQEADAIILVVDGKQNRAAIEQNVLKKFRKAGKPLLLCVNKLDSARTVEEKIGEFSSLGIKPAFGISSISGRGIGDMLDYVADLVRGNPGGAPSSEADTKLEGAPLAPPIAIAIVGKPNVGKSSIFNKILKQERAVVSPIPGTTRTAIDSNININNQDYTFIDTAGLKKKEHRQQQPDIFSGFQTFKSIRRSDVCFFVIDAIEEITKQDQKVAQEIFSQEKGVIVLVNKIDLFSPKKSSQPKRGETGRIIHNPSEDKYQQLRDYVSDHFPFLWLSPMFFVSGLTGEGLAEALEAIKPIYDRRHKIIDDATLKDFLAKVMKKNEPKLLRDQKKPKVIGLTQTATNPPKFELLVNHPAAISQQFRKFLLNSIIKYLDFWGTPVSLHLKGKDKA